jgi:nucleosome binding factor SPN SPT16 subunit
VFSKHVKKEIVTIVDVEKKVKHSKLAEDIEQAIVDGKYSPPGSAEDVVSCTYTVAFFWLYTAGSDIHEPDCFHGCWGA